MKNYYSVFLLFCLGCSNQKLHSAYKSSCFLYNKTELELKLNSNSDFSYKFAYLDEEIKGNWERRADTLYLYSNKFLEKQENLTPKIKNTDFNGLDKYLIKKGKLYSINKKGVSLDCYLKP